MHDHMFYTAAGGVRNQMSFTGPRLYLASGVTTVRTTGSRSPYADINLKQAVDSGEVPGPRIHVTTPYLTGAGGRRLDVGRRRRRSRRGASWPTGRRRAPPGSSSTPTSRAPR